MEGLFGGGWYPSRAANAFKGQDGKLKSTMMMCIEAGDPSVCFGMVGTKRFCRGAGCRIKMHLKTKFNMGCTKRWFLGAKGQQTTNSPT